MLRLITKATQKIEYWAPSTKLLYHITSRYYREVIGNEVDLASITANDEVLFIGGGFCPFSAILLHQTTGAKITVTDNDSDCIPRAVKAISQLELGDCIHIQCRDGACPNFDLSQFSVVHFALQITPLNQVFAEVERRVNPGTRLLVRRPKNHLDKMYCKFSNAVVGCCRYVRHGSMSNIGVTQLYIKQKPSVARIAA
ncbi:MAG: hypothetical protein FWE48_01305 [Coriobacteriia bacterium]|nr:hypothetical protein [Coriobacteriia bacterium]MCL2745717.1 hypothetical protein [Coriobacteriia bacterium]MCL2871074.1 hypothetical protein [Coriobacteriia bacterium]